MVDSINTSSANSLLRAQQTAQTQQTQATRTPPATINQTRAAAVAPVQASSVPQTTKIVSANSNLPRGSIVDRLV